MRAKQVAICLVSVLISAAPGLANPVERACNGSDRAAATRSLCSCIGSVADQTLSRGDQRQAARLFDDPDAAEALRMSDNSSDEAFWDRYTDFGQHAASNCG